MKYRIADSQDPVSITLYWNNENGWGSLETATVFHDYEKERLNTPVGGYWIHVPQRWQNAIDVQNAVNLSGVVHTLADAIKECHLERLDTMGVRDDEAVRLIVNKVASLTRQHELERELRQFALLIEACETKAKN